MATGGTLAEDDSRVTCSVCLEAYEGRQPKLLPCYHTFCLPCLNQLTNQARGQTRATITCPTCRAIHTLPPGGASSLQTNFYIDNSDPPRPNTQDDLQAKVKEQLRVMQAVTSQLPEDEKEVERQRRAMEAGIHQRYEAGLRVLDEYRDQCLNSVKDVTRQLTDKLQADLLFAQSLLKPLQDLAAEGSSRPQTMNSSTHPALLGDAVLRHFRQLSTGGQQPSPPLFFYDHSDDTADLTNAVRHFMGTVLPSSGGGASPQIISNDQGKKAWKSTAEFMAGDEEWGKSQQQQLRALQTLVHQMQTDSEQQKKELSTLKQRVNDDVATIKRDLTATTTDMGRLQKDVTAASTDVGSLQKDVTTVQKNTNENQQSWKQMNTVMSKLQSQLDKSSTPVFFTVQLTNNVTIAQNKILRLDRVMDNTGGGYNMTTGIFTAPHAGTYLFLATARADYDHEKCLKSSMKNSRFCIMVNGVSVVSSWGKGPLTFTAHAIVRLQAGHQAFLKTEKCDNQSFRGEGFTSFCGALLNPNV